jgi:hypothetical protein
MREFTKIPRTVKDARISWLYAQALAADNKPSGAETAWKQVLQSGLYDEVAHWGLAILYGAPPAGRAVDADKALKHARSACDLATSENWMCVDALAIAHAAGGDFDEAIVQGRRAAELTSGDRREICLEHVKQFESKQRVSWNWME